MKLLDAAYIVLKDAGKPLNYKEITKLMIEKELYVTDGKTPSFTVSSRLSEDIRNNPNNSRFIKVSNGLYTIKEFALDSQNYGDIDVNSTNIGSYKSFAKENTTFSGLLAEIATNRKQTIEALVDDINKAEINEREEIYPKLLKILMKEDIDKDDFDNILKYLPGSKWDKISLKGLASVPNFYNDVIYELIHNFPLDDEKAIIKINDVINNILRLATNVNDSKLGRSQAGLFCSQILTTLYPDRFVDFRQERWKSLAEKLGYDLPNPDASYGEMIVWAGHVAQKIAEEPKFRYHWKNDHPLWAVAGLAWNLKYSSINDDIIEESVRETKIQMLFQKKRQIILYGPPGTGKTWHAQNLLRSDGNHYYSQMKSTLLDQRIFSITIWPPRDGSILDLEPGERFTYVWNGRRNWQKFYDELEAGDYLLAFYPSPTKQYKAILRCDRKDENAIQCEFVRKWDGPTYQQMKSDSILSETTMIRVSMSFSLKKLEDIEFERIQALSPDLTSESLGLVSTRDEEKINKIEFVTFHPSFGYEEFIEGLRPNTDENGSLTFHIHDGIFKQFAQRACNILFKEAGIDKQWLPEGNIPKLDDGEKERIREMAPTVPFYLVIDEINRGDISRIFGELITLLEADKRYGEANEITTTLPYSKTSFAIPPNLYLIGTMNTADKSIALVDTALRRRFGFIEMMPDYELLGRLFANVPEEVKAVAELATSFLEEINTRIRNRYDRDHQIGHSYLVPLKDSTTRDGAIEILHSAWYYEILPLLQEYFYDSPKKLHEVIGDAFVSVEGDHSFCFRDELSGEQFLIAIEGIGSPYSGARNDEGSD